MHVQNLELHSKIKDLLLNKIENLSWNYFDIDLNAALHNQDVYATEDKILTFFGQIKPTGFGRYEFTGKIETKEVVKILFTIIKFNPTILPNIIRSLFKSNEIVNNSESDEGFLGKFNRKNREARDKKFKKQIREGFRGKKDNIVILAEGDSWFQFPKIYVKDPVKDIIDWLLDDPKYAIKSLAAGGDWLANIFYSGEYIEELPKISPDVFLISGGGNDLVGGNRLAIMVINTKLEGKNDLTSKPFDTVLNKRKSSPNINIKKYKKGLEFVSKDFFKFLNLYFVQYFVFLYNIANHEKYKKMIIITHGYDYPIPYNKNRGNWISFQRIVNEFTDTGHWLFQPLNMKGIINKSAQEAVMYTLIYEFNEMLIQLANFNGMKNVFHIDCRGIAKEKDWFDELHLRSETFEKVSETFKHCINQNIGLESTPTKKVYRVKDISS